MTHWVVNVTDDNREVNFYGSFLWVSLVSLFSDPFKRIWKSWQNINRVCCYSDYYKMIKRKNSSLSAHAHIKNRNQICAFSFAFDSFLFHLVIPFLQFLPYIIYSVVIIFTVLWVLAFFRLVHVKLYNKSKETQYICHDVVKFQTPASRKKY